MHACVWLAGAQAFTCVVPALSLFYTRFLCVRVDRSWLVDVAWLLGGVGTVDVCYHASLGPVSWLCFFYMTIDQQLNGVRSGSEGTEAPGGTLFTDARH